LKPVYKESKMFRITKHRFTLSMIVSIAVSLAACGPAGPERGLDGSAGSAPQVSVVTLEAAPLTLTTKLPGRIVAYRVAEIRPQVSGIIQQRRFTQGDDVTAGDVLYQIDPAQYQANFDQAQATLGVAEANLPAQKSRAERLQKMVAARAASQQDADDAIAAWHRAEANVKAAEAALELARVNLAYTPITAPITGRIGASRVTEGALVTAYQPVALAVIQQIDPVYVDVTQSTAEVLRLQKALGRGGLMEGEGAGRVSLILEDGSTYEHDGELAFRDVSVNSATGSVTVRIVFPNPGQVLLPGMFVRAVVQEGVMSAAVLVPQQGVTRNTRGEAIALVVRADNTVEERMLQIDRAVGADWLVTGGLVPGEKLIVEGSLNVRPGSTVNPVDFGKASSGQPEDAAPALSLTP
jgi:membrane fusion protein (multidrug efflux system)